MSHDFTIELRAFFVDTRCRVNLKTPHSINANLYLPYSTNPTGYTLHAAPHWVEGNIVDGVYEGESMQELLEDYFDRTHHALDAAYLAYSWVSIIQDTFNSVLIGVDQYGADDITKVLASEEARMNALALTLRA